MKLVKLLALAGCATFVLASCDLSVGAKKQLKYNHTTLVDSDAYAFFQTVGGKAVYEKDYAEFIASTGASAKAKDLATKSKDFYSSLIPIIDELATEFQVNFPIRGAAQFESPLTESANEQDSSSSIIGAQVPFVFDEEAYVQHVQKETAIVYEQLKRVSRNTNEKIRDFATSKIDEAKELYTLAGGTIDEGAHH